VLVVVPVVVVGGTVVVVRGTVVVGTTWRTGLAAMATGAAGGTEVVGVGSGIGGRITWWCDGTASPGTASAGTEATAPFWDSRSGTMSTAPHRSNPTACRLPR